MTDMPELKSLKFWWADDEEGPYQGPFDTEEQALSEAYCYRAKCFDDPSQADGFYLLHGSQYKNPEYSDDYPRDWYDNAPYHITGKPKYILGIDVTDTFHDAWKSRPTPPADDNMSIGDRYSLMRGGVTKQFLLNKFSEPADALPTEGYVVDREDLEDAAGMTIEKMESALVACRDWDIPGIIHEVTRDLMAKAYLEHRRALQSPAPVTDAQREALDAWARIAGRIGSMSYMFVGHGQHVEDDLQTIRVALSAPVAKVDAKPTIDSLIEIMNYFGDRMDADHNGASYIANEEMKMMEHCCVIERFLGCLTSKSDKGDA